MKNITLKSMALVNFKGIRSLTINFDAKQTSILGRNGSGKTTIFDGFIWLLFGKDHTWRKQFSLKTLDSHNSPIPKIPHEVSATLIVNGEEITLCRRFNEKWQKKRGYSVEEFRGHEEERFYNGIPCSLSEWNSKINGICSEEVFKAITSPLYFMSQKPDTQRALLFKMAGTVSDADIAVGNADFTKLLASLTGKTITEYKKEITAKKSRIKGELEQLPPRIDERNRDNATLTEDWDAIEQELNDRTNELSDIESRMSVNSTVCRSDEEKQTRIFESLSALRGKISDRIYLLKENALSDYRKYYSEHRRLIDEHDTLNDLLTTTRARIERIESALDELTSRREKLVDEWKSLHAAIKTIKAEQVSFEDEDFICPQCGRPYGYEDIEKIQRHRTECFENDRRKRLSDIAEQLADNERKGKQISSEKESILAEKENTEAKLKLYCERIDTIKKNPIFQTAPEKPDENAGIETDDELCSLRSKEKQLAEQLDSIGHVNDSDEDTKRKETLAKDIDVLKCRLSKRDMIAANKSRISELENRLRELSDELAQLEGTEFTIQEFSKTRTKAIENRINSLFGFVRFKLFDTQINGAEIETCEALINGVPVSDANTAGKVNAGIDIINAICRHEGVTAPIFLDNAESVTHINQSDSQLIKLLVSEKDELTILN